MTFKIQPPSRVQQFWFLCRSNSSLLTRHSCLATDTKQQQQQQQILSSRVLNTWWILYDSVHVTMSERRWEGAEAVRTPADLPTRAARRGGQPARPPHVLGVHVAVELHVLTRVVPGASADACGDCRVARVRPEQRLVLRPPAVTVGCCRVGVLCVVYWGCIEGGCPATVGDYI